MGDTWIKVEATPEHVVAEHLEMRRPIWAVSQMVEAREYGSPQSRLMGSTPHEVLSFLGRGASAATMVA